MSFGGLSIEYAKLNCLWSDDTRLVGWLRMLDDALWKHATLCSLTYFCLIEG